MVRDGVLELRLPGAAATGPIEDPEFAGAFDVIGFSLLQRDRRARHPCWPCQRSDQGTVSARRAGPARWATCRGAAGLRLVLDKLHAELPGKPLLISEYGIGTDDDSERGQFIRDGGGDCRGRDRAAASTCAWSFDWTGIDSDERQPRPSACRSGCPAWNRAPRPERRKVMDTLPRARSTGRRSRRRRMAQPRSCCRDPASKSPFPALILRATTTGDE